MVQDIYIDEDVKKICGGDGRTLGFSAPVLDSKGRVIGVWNNRANFALLESMLTSAGHDLKTQGLTDVRLTLIDRAGRIIADYDPTHAENDALSRNMEVLMTVNLADRGITSARQARTGHDGVAHEEDPRRGVWQMTGYAASRGALGFPGLGWGLLARVDDKQTADASGSRARSEVTGVLISSLLLLGLAAWWLGRSIALSLIHISEPTRPY